MDARVARAEPTITLDHHEYGLVVRLAGDWTIATSRKAEAAIAALPRDTSGIPMHVEFCFKNVGAVDSAGAMLIHKLRGYAEYKGRRVLLTNCSTELHTLLDQIERFTPRPYEEPPKPYMVIRALAEIGRTMATASKDAMQLLAILGIFGARLTSIFSFTRKMRGVSILSNFDRTCRGAVPITMLMSFLVGLIIAQQAGFYLRTFGADLFVVDLSGVLILRELGVLLAAILVAGRSGSAFTAEIGSMRMREEVDALNVLGVDPVEVLVVPRLMALMLAIPVLAFLSDIAAIAGAVIITWFYLGITPDLFFQRLDDAVTPLEFWIGIAKAPFMALIIGLVACNEGLKVGGSAESLGRHTTSSVVKAIFLVIVVDGLFAMFFAAIGI